MNLKVVGSKLSSPTRDTAESEGGKTLVGKEPPNFTSVRTVSLVLLLVYSIKFE